MYKKYEELLRKTGKTTYQVCKETGIRPSTIYNWKARGGSLSAGILVKLAEYFGVTVDSLIKDDN